MNEDQLRKFVQLCYENVDAGCTSCACTAVLCLVAVKPELQDILCRLWIEVHGPDDRHIPSIKEDFEHAATKGVVW